MKHSTSFFGHSSPCFFQCHSLTKPIRAFLFCLIWLGPAGHLLAQNWVPGNPFVDSIPVVSSCSLAPAILVPNSGNPTGTVSQNPLKFVFSNVASNADRYRIQINAGNSIAGWDSLNGFGFEGAKPNTLYEFTDNLNNASDVVRNIPVASLNGPGDYYITARQLIPGNAPNPCMGQAFGPSEYTTPQHFNIPKPNLVLGPTGFQCFISGTIATCSLRVVNDGFFDVNTFKVGFYISADTILTGSNPDFRYQVINIDTGTFGSGIAGGLAAGDTTAWLMSTIDLATITARAPGEYNLGVIIDYTAVVMESNETDNNHLIVGQTAQVPVNTLEADLATPVDGLIIDRNNTGTYIDTAGDLRITGTANAANVADIRVFSNGVQVSTVSQPITNPWTDTISVVAGTNDLYVNVVCNYSFCSSSGVNSATRSITYMKPLGPSAVVADDLNGTLTVNWQKHTEPGTANFRYRVYRNTLPVPDSGSEWVALSNWTNGSQLIDTVPQRGIAYYYWVVCARNVAGANPSAYGDFGTGFLIAPIEFSRDTISIDCDTVSDTLQVISGALWTASADSAWITVSPNSGSSSTTLVVSVVPNSNGTLRYGKVSVSGLGTQAEFWVAQGDTLPCYVASLPLAFISNQQCNDTLSSVNQYVYYTGVSGASAYRIQVLDSAGVDHPIFKNWSAANFQLSQAMGIASNATYAVAIAAEVNGIWTDYGPTCMLTTPPELPVTQFVPINCNDTVASLDEWLNVNSIPGAADYRFEITPLLGPSIIYDRGGPWPNFRMEFIPGVAYNTTYSIRVKAAFGSEFAEYGDSCLISTPDPPTTQLLPNQCNQTIASWSTYLFYDGVPAATDYQFELTDLQNNVIVDERNAPSALLLLGWISGIQASTTYSMRIRPFIDGSWGTYGPPCTITTPPGPVLRRATDPFAAQAEDQMKCWKAYAPAGSSKLVLQYTGEGKSLPAFLELFDLSGRTIARMPMASLGSGQEVVVQRQLPMGTYLLVLHAAEAPQYQQKVMVR